MAEVPRAGDSFQSPTSRPAFLTPQNRATNMSLCNFNVKTSAATKALHGGVER